jgi:hypothetical protein
MPQAASLAATLVFATACIGALAILGLFWARRISDKTLRQIIMAFLFGLVTMTGIAETFFIGGGGRGSFAVALLSPGYFTIKFLELPLGFEDISSGFATLGIDTIYYALLSYLVLLGKEYVSKVKRTQAT